MKGLHRASTRHRLAALSLGALGVVYGDIGTSPLYAFREAIHATGGRAASETGVLGILSLITWALIVIVTIKYLAVVMRADNHGEGGILALTALILPREGAARRWRRVLVFLGLFGTALLYGDGIITPAISVLAAVEGLEIATPALAPYVVPIAIGVLLALFAVQHTGTATVGAVFGPVMTLWFTTLAALGLWHLVQSPEVLAAVSPVHAVWFIGADPALAFLALGGVFLVVTGAEALYADLGHFGRRPIQLTWFVLVLPALLLNYFGQGALLLAQPTTATNPFYLMAPGWALLPLVVLATAATVIASQALITGAFSLTMQAVQLGFLPRMRIDHTSSREFGQVYLPLVNLALMIACIVLVLGFRSSANLAAAYGMAVTSTMVITTLLLAAVARQRWRWTLVATIAAAGGFLLVDVAFLSANVVKIPAGGWLPLVVGAVLLTVMTTWHHGRRIVEQRRRLGSVPLEAFVADLGDRDVARVAGTAIYLGADEGRTPRALEANLTTHHMLHERVLVVTVQITDRARVTDAARATVHDLGWGFHQVTLRFGFMEDPQVPPALRGVLPSELEPSLEEAVYFVGRETIAVTEEPGMARWREQLFVLLHRNASTIVRYLGLPRDRIIEIGAVVDL